MKKIHLIYLSLSLLLAHNINATENIKRTPSDNTNDSFLTIDTQIGEFLVPGEAKATAELMTLFTKHMKKAYEDKKKSALRAVHAKSHGCLNGTFEVFPHDNTELKFSIFSSPKKYPALIRFSNGDGPPAADNDKLVSLGLGVKIFDINLGKLLPSLGENSLDLLFINQPAFLVKDVVDFADVIRARESGGLGKLNFAIHHHDAIRFRKLADPKGDPLNTTFWSVLPFRLGNLAVKYIAIPCGSTNKNLPKKLTANYLADLVKTHIEKESGCYDFFLQKRLMDGSETTNMPIENARIIWDEKKSVPIKVGRLTIPIQSPATGTAAETCEKAKLNPWNTTTDFRPIGNLNRIRKPVYDLSSHERHKINQTTNPFEDKK